MLSAELQIAVSFSLVLGAIFGALLCSYMRVGRNRLLPSEAAFQACLELREKLEMLQQALQTDVFCAPHPTRRTAPAVVAGRPSPAAPARAALPAAVEYDPPVSSKDLPDMMAWHRLERSRAHAPPAGVDYDPPVSSKDLPDMMAWHRIERSRDPAHHASRCPRPEEAALVAPVRRRSRGTERPAAINARIAQEIVLRHFGVAMNPLPGPAAARADLTGKLLRMPVSHVGEPPCDEQSS